MTLKINKNKEKEKKKKVNHNQNCSRGYHHTESIQTSKFQGMYFILLQSLH